MSRRRRRIHSGTLLALLAVIFAAAWLASKAMEFAGTIELVLGGAAAALAALVIIRSLDRLVSRNALLRRIGDVTTPHLPALLRRNGQLVSTDAYGKPQLDRWNREIEYFLDQHVAPALTAGERRLLARNHLDAVAAVARQVAAAGDLGHDQPKFSNDMSAAAFEAFCAAELRRAGWDARVSPVGPDQGVDVIAEKGGVRVVLQCKLHARPIGNKAVQEATAARAHERAAFGVVVSNNRYTDAAVQLAASNRILLLHYRDLPRLAALLDC